MKFLHGYTQATTTGQFLRWAFTMIGTALVLVITLSLLADIAGHWGKTFTGAMLVLVFAVAALISSIMILGYVIAVAVRITREIWKTQE